MQLHLQVVYHTRWSTTSSIRFLHRLHQCPQISICRPYHRLRCTARIRQPVHQWNCQFSSSTRRSRLGWQFPLLTKLQQPSKAYNCKWFDPIDSTWKIQLHGDYVQQHHQLLVHSSDKFCAFLRIQLWTLSQSLSRTLQIFFRSWIRDPCTPCLASAGCSCYIFLR